MLSEFLIFSSRFLRDIFDCCAGPLEEPFLINDDGIFFSTYKFYSLTSLDYFCFDLDLNVSGSLCFRDEIPTAFFNSSVFISYFASIAI